MRILFIIFCFFLSVTITYSQFRLDKKEIILANEEYRIILNLNPSQNKFEQLSSSKIQSDVTFKSFANHLTSFYEDGDIVFQYKISKSNGDKIIASLNVVDENYQKLTPTQENIQFYFDESKKQFEIRWNNIFEEFKRLSGEIECVISLNLIGLIPKGIDCSHPPEFNLRERLPYYSAGIIGIGAIGIGQIYRIQKDDVYKRYREENIKEIAQPLYEEANSKNRTYFVLTVTGFSILSIDGLLYLLKARKHKKNMSLHKKYCTGKKVTILPTFDISPISSNVGIKIRF